MPLPVGLVYDAAHHVTLDPDTAVRGAVTHLFATFEATGSATACVKAFRAAGLLFPWRHLKGPRKSEVGWQPLAHHTVLRILHNPRYAGCCPAPSGSPSSPAPTPDTSPRTSTTPTSPSWPPTPPPTAKTAAADHPAKEPRSCRASSSAASAGCG